MTEKMRQDSARHALNPLGEVSDTLKGEVSQVLHRNLPSLDGVAAETVYDAVLDRPEVLDESFKLFRSRPELFQSVMVDKDARPVTGDDVVLRCGRTMADIISLVVRASAKRYFKRRIPTPKVPQPKLGTMQQFMITLGLSAPPPPKRPVSRADKLFAAIRDRLLYEWQALMIPAYATLSPQFVADLGPHLLKFQIPEQLLAVSSSPDGADARNGQAPLLVDEAGRVLTADGRIDEALALKVAKLLKLGQLFDGGDAATRVDEATAAIGTVGPQAVEEVLAVLGHDCRLFVTFFYAAYACLGVEDFRHFLGKDAMPRIVKRWMDALQTPPDATVQAMKTAYFAVLGGRRTGAVAISG